MTIKVASFCMQGQSSLEIKTQDHFQTRFDAMNPMTVSELVNKLSLKIVFFEVSIVVLICLKFQYLNIWSFVLKTEHIPRLVLMSKV